MPLVGYAERDFVDLVVRLDTLDDLHHELLPLSPAESFGRTFLPGGRVVGWGSGPDSRKKASSTPILSRAATSFPREGPPYS